MGGYAEKSAVAPPWPSAWTSSEAGFCRIGWLTCSCAVQANEAVLLHQLCLAGVHVHAGPAANVHYSHKLVTPQVPTCWDGLGSSPLGMDSLVRFLKASGAGEPAVSTGARARGAEQLNNFVPTAELGLTVTWLLCVIVRYETLIHQLGALHSPCHRLAV